MTCTPTQTEWTNGQGKTFNLARHSLIKNKHGVIRDRNDCTLRARVTPMVIFHGNCSFPNTQR